MSANEKTLESRLDTVKKTVKTDAYPMSIGELHSMYERGELILKPVYQRYFRWTLGQKTKLIESILIGLPLPSFFVASDEDGNWEVVDGMQRLSTIFEFMGDLKDERQERKRPLQLSDEPEDLIYLPEFCGKRWEDLSRRIQLDFRRSKMQLTILMRTDSLEAAKFDLFQRLNSGGTKITGQELRNAMMAEKKPEMLLWTESLAGDENFKDAVGLSDKDMEGRYDMELVLRFILFLSGSILDIRNISSVDAYLTSELRKLMEYQYFDMIKEEERFLETFKVINQSFGQPGALRASANGRFSIAAFEAVALGIAQNIDRLPEGRVIAEKIKDLGNQAEFKNASGSGAGARSRLPKLLEFGKKYFAA